jgi:hypothetical protein
MTGTIGSAATLKVMERMRGTNSVVGSVTAGVFGPSQLRSQNVALELAERAATVQYPIVHIYCDKVINDQREKFRSFSGRAQMTIEVRHSQDRLDALQDALEVYADAAAQALSASRGDWGDGMSYNGGYEISFGAAKQGGKNFVQVAKVTFEIQVSRN